MSIHSKEKVEVNLNIHSATKMVMVEVNEKKVVCITEATAVEVIEAKGELVEES